MATNPKKTKSTEQAGVWFLSYLCEAGYIKNQDDIFSGFVDGPVMKEFAGLPVGTYVGIKVDSVDVGLFHVYIRGESEAFDSDDEDNCWWQSNSCPPNFFVSSQLCVRI